MHIGPDGTCQSGWWPEKEKPALLAGENFTATELAAYQAEEDRRVAFNVALAFTWCLIIPTMVATAGLRAHHVLRRGRSIVAEEAQTPYAKLPGAIAA